MYVCRDSYWAVKLIIFLPSIFIFRVTGNKHLAIVRIMIEKID